MTELTALQQIMDGPEQAQEVLDAFENAEEEHPDADNPVPCCWQLTLDIHEPDLPKLREELQEYIDGTE